MAQTKILLSVAAPLALLLSPTPSRAASPMEPVLQGCGTQEGWHPRILNSHLLRPGESFELLTPDGVAEPGDPGNISQTCDGFYAYYVVSSGSDPTNVTLNWDFDRYPIADRRLSCANGAACMSEQDCRDAGSSRCIPRDGCGHGHLDYAAYIHLLLSGMEFYVYAGGGGKDGERQGSQCVFTSHPNSPTGHEFWGEDSIDVHPIFNDVLSMVILVQGHSHGAVSCGNFLCFPGGILSVHH
jgi:hypothetical protein